MKRPTKWMFHVIHQSKNRVVRMYSGCCTSATYEWKVQWNGCFTWNVKEKSIRSDVRCLQLISDLRMSVQQNGCFTWNIKVKIDLFIHTMPAVNQWIANERPTKCMLHVKNRDENGIARGPRRIIVRMSANEMYFAVDMRFAWNEG